MALANYDTTTVGFSFETMTQALMAIAGPDPANPTGLIGEVADGLNSIMTTLQNLALSWVGTAASDADSFNDSWNSAMTELFGTSADPGQGAFPRMVAGLVSAFNNYTGVEMAAISTLSAFSSTSGGSGSGSTAQSVTNTSGATQTTAIQVTFS